MSKKFFWSFAIGYGLATFLMNTVFDNKIGEVMMQISYIALAGIVIWFVYTYLKYAIKQQIYNHKHKQE